MTLLEGVSPRDKALVVIPCITGSISFVSSSIMAYMIWADRKGSTNQAAKNHLLLALCISDFFISLAYACSTFLGPSYHLQYYETPQPGSTQIGTDFTCSLQAVFNQIGLCQPSYNAALCVYHLLVIRFHKTDRQLRTWVMPAIHFFIISFNIAGAVAGVALDAFHYAGVLGCYFHNPCEIGSNLEVEGCPIENPPNYDLLQTIFIAVPLSLAFMIMVFSLATIYLTLRRVEQRSMRWSYAASIRKHQLPWPSVIFDTEAPGKFDHLEGSMSQQPTKSMKKKWLPGSSVVSHSEPAVNSDNLEDSSRTQQEATESCSDGQHSSSDETTPNIMPAVHFDELEQDATGQHPAKSQDVSTSHTNYLHPGDGSPSAVSRRPSSSPTIRRKMKKSIAKGARDVGLQYFISFLITYLPLCISAFVSPGWIRIMMVFFTPLQGFWNLLFFLQGRVNDLSQERHPRASFSWKVWASIAAYPKYAR